MERWLLVIAVCGGCEVWNAPGKVKELEGRVTELSNVVSAMVGKPVGAGSGAGSGSAAGSAADGHEAKPAAPEHAAPAGEHASAPPADDHGPKAKPKEPEEPHAAHWTYTGKEGPATWASLDPAWQACDGKSQSPIDIEPRAGKASAITFDYKPTAAKIVDNGHTLQVNLEPGSKIELDDRSYELVQFHVHTPSEHAIAGEHLPMEVHLVHSGPGGKLAVIGVLYDVGDGKVLDPVWSKWPKKTNVEAKLAKFDPSTLLPETRTLFRYTGSLTTPPCTEGVVWNVMRRTKTVSKAQLDVLKMHYPMNARPTMPLGEREVI